jgi:hypothetical protein
MYAYCLDMPGATEDIATQVDDAVGSEPVAGLIAHVSGPARDGWRIIDIWESAALPGRAAWACGRPRDRRHAWAVGAVRDPVSDRRERTEPGRPHQSLMRASLTR